MRLITDIITTVEHDTVPFGQCELNYTTLSMLLRTITVYASDLYRLTEPQVRYILVGVTAQLRTS